jgi:hypothetical protein
MTHCRHCYVGCDAAQCWLHAVCHSADSSSLSYMMSVQNAHWCVSQNHKSAKTSPHSTVCSCGQHRNLRGLEMCCMEQVWTLTQPFRTALHQIGSGSFDLRLTLSSVPLLCTRSVLCVEFFTVICVLCHFLDVWIPVIVLWLCQLHFVQAVRWGWLDPAILLCV